MQDGRISDDGLHCFLDELLLSLAKPPPTTYPIKTERDNPGDVDDAPNSTTPSPAQRPCLAKDLKKLLPSARARITGLRATLDQPLTVVPALKLALVKDCYEAIWEADRAELSQHQRETYLHAYDGKFKSRMASSLSQPWRR